MALGASLSFDGEPVAFCFPFFLELLAEMVGASAFILVPDGFGTAAFRPAVFGFEGFADAAD